MGCISSKPKNGSLTADTSISSTTAQLYGSGPLSIKEIQSRIVDSKKSLPLEIGGMKIRYGFVSQRGYYPDSLSKANQDAFCVHTNYTNNSNRAFFGVFDGHGKEGHLCAQFVRDNLPKLLGSYLENDYGVLESLKHSHIQTNDNLHDTKQIDDTLSGTTSISLFVNDKEMYIANVGDSRAIIAQGNDDNGRLSAKPLSFDQTPYRKDERERVKKYGARVLSMDQIEGLEPIHENWGDVRLGEELDEGGDPPRIWSPHGDYPGTAFTRSCGDAIAEELGVTADPEILNRQFSANDKFIIIASDGVFEFLTNQTVVDMVSNYDDPLEACRAVVAEAYELWLQYEIRTDDITMIAIYIDDPGKDAKATRNSLDVDEIKLSEMKPVRRQFSREMRRKMMAPNHEDENENFDINDYIVDKNDEEKKRIAEAIKTSFLFQHLNNEQRDMIFQVMSRIDVEPGQVIIREGDDGDRFYVVDHGRFEVRVATNDQERENADGEVVHVYSSDGDYHPSFGELALMYSQPRKASVIAMTDGTLWALDRPIFRRVLMKSSRRDLIKTLRNVDVFQNLNVRQLQRLGDVITEVEFNEGEYIIKQGEPGDSLYIIKSGSCDIRQKKLGFDRLLDHYGPNQYFGEKALLHDEPRGANVIATSKTVCLYISKKAFEEVLGPLQRIIDEDARKREEEAESKKLDDIPELTSLTYSTLTIQDETSIVSLKRINNDEKIFTLQTFFLGDIQRMKTTSSIKRDAEILRLLSKEKVPFTTILLEKYITTDTLHFLFSPNTIISCSLDSISNIFKNNEELVKNLAAHLIVVLTIFHEHCILYRGLFPDIIGIQPNGTPILYDYRMSKLIHDQTFTICGTPEYLSPEQVAHQGHNMSTDFWALGILLYELYNGTSPFAGESEIEIFQKIASHEKNKLPRLKNASKEFLQFLNDLCDPDADSRLGANIDNGLNEFRNIDILSNVDWDTLPDIDGARQIASSAQEKMESTNWAEVNIIANPPQYSGDRDWLEKL